VKSAAGHQHFVGFLSKTNRRKASVVKKFSMPVNPNIPDCLKCKFFKVSWDAAFPRACTQFDIKCRSLPSVEVFNATRQPCPAFTIKDVHISRS
jgi:hypothetical protein